MRASANRSGRVSSSRPSRSRRIKSLSSAEGSTREGPAAATDVFAALNQQVPPEAQSGGGRGNRAGRNAPGAGASAQAGTSGAAPAATAAPGNTGVQSAPGMHASGGQSTGGGRGFDPARMMERFKSMPPDEQKQFIARLKDLGQRAAKAGNHIFAVERVTVDHDLKGAIPSKNLNFSFIGIY